MLIQREPFDYTYWRETQYTDKSVETVFAEAAARRAGLQNLNSKKKPAPYRRAKAK